ncbi:MAG: ribonuclease catalytic domain-containing protein [Peptostreptococcaceae bacterium]|nr:ribonuclease catalytic domain-containing protein [Peptostreptococcaceae bacterium]
MEHNIPYDFPEKFLELKEEDFPDDCDYRKDLTHQRCITIDGEDTKDIDDAVFLERTDKGFRLWTHIADVASFLRQNDALYEEAETRGTSIYLPTGEVIRMLPPLLSEHLCSLKPGKIRRAISFCIDLDQNLNVSDLKIYKSHICSKIQASYLEVDKILSREDLTDPDLREKYDLSTQKMLLDLNLLTKDLANKRHKETSLPKKKITVIDENVVIQRDQQTPSHRVIEECMVLTNREVSQFMNKNKLPVIFRIQEKTGNLASYSTRNEGHKELKIHASNGESYSHITSPIRRFSDCVNHMILNSYLDGYSISEIQEEFSESYLEYLTLQLSKRSNRARTLVNHQNKICEGHFILGLPEKDRFIKGYLLEQLRRRDRIFSKFQIELQDIPFIVSGEFKATAFNTTPEQWYKIKLDSREDGSLQVTSWLPIT